jgi:hypothetical protein
VTRPSSEPLHRLAREAVQSALPPTWRVDEVRSTRTGGWSVRLTHLRTDRSLVIELTARTLDDAVHAAKTVIGAAGLADALPASTSVVIAVARQTGGAASD